MQDTTAVDFVPPRLFKIPQFSERHPAFSQAALRNYILNAEDRFNSHGEKIHGNGWAQSGAIVRLGRRVLIDEQKFFAHIAARQKPAARAA